MKKGFALLLVCLFAVSMCLTGCAKKYDVIKITHKDYTEQRITGQLMAVYLESKGFKTQVTELSGTMLCYTALKNGDVDMYAEFTGTAYGAIFDQTEIIGVQETYDYVKQEAETRDKITWLEPLGWNNTYVLSVRAETAEEFNLTTIDDLIAVAPTLVMGCDDEFQNRSDGLPGLQEVYPGLAFKDVVSMDQGLTYAALDNGDIDVNVSYSTDGRIAKFGLINLIDNKNFFPRIMLRDPEAGLCRKESQGCRSAQ
jgi:glycine betaine/choline ABC-type transport system substrate-binding protein